MSQTRSAAEVVALVQELLTLPSETEWVEFKVNNPKHAEIGEYISALANSAALLDKPRAHVVWGVEDGTRKVFGTTFEPATAKQGNERHRAREVLLDPKHPAGSRCSPKLAQRLRSP